MDERKLERNAFNISINSASVTADRRVVDLLSAAERLGVEEWCGRVIEGARAGVRAATGGEGTGSTASSARTLLAGVGAGAALALQLARAGGLHVLALAPPLLTAEGEWTGQGQGGQGGQGGVATGAALLVVGESGSRSGRGPAAEWAIRRGRRASLLMVGGADDALRLPPRRRRLLGLSQRAVDAAIAVSLVSGPPVTRSPGHRSRTYTM